MPQDNNKEQFEAIAKRLEKIFGAKTEISKLYDFNGVPSFNIKLGKDKDEADKIIDRIVPVRNATGLTKDNLGFNSDKDGNMIIQGGNLMNISNGKFSANEDVFKILEKPETAKKFQDAIKNPTQHDPKFQAIAERLEKIFGAKTEISNLYDFNGVPSFNIKAGATQQDADAVIDKLVTARKAAGITKDDFAFRSDKGGNVVISGTNVLNFTEDGKSSPNEKLFKILEDKKNVAAFQSAFPKKISFIAPDELKGIGDTLKRNDVATSAVDSEKAKPMAQSTPNMAEKISSLRV